jgi:hypothetical protein
MDSELSLIKFCFMNYWAVTISTRPFQPTSTLLIKLVEALISSEPDPDPKHKERVKWIYNHTHKIVNIPLSTVELVVFKNIDKGLNCEIDLDDKSFYLFELYNILDEISKELSNIVIEIAKRYSLDIPMLSSMGKSQLISIDMEK